MKSSIRCISIGGACLALFAMAHTAVAQESEENESETRPIAVVESPVHDFGEVWVSDPLNHSFVIRNAGKSRLEIKKVKPTCGCTLAGNHPQFIEPGESGQFPFRLNTNKIKGKFTKAISVITSDPENKTITLRLTGVVKQYVDVTPQTVQFGRVKEDTVVSETLTITNNTDTPLKLSIDEKTNPQCFKGKIKELIPGKKYELTVTAQPPFRTGINRFPLKIDTNIPNQQQLNIFCIATLPERLQIKPDRLIVSASAKTESVRKLWFTNNGEKPVKVTKASCGNPGVKVEKNDVEEGKKYLIVVTIPPRFKPGKDEAVVVETDDPEKPRITIPFQESKTRATRKRERPAMKMKGEKAPQAKKSTWDGKDAVIGGPSDKVQVVMFYASWCGFCKKALPVVQGLHERFLQEGLAAEVKIVNLDDSAGKRGRTQDQSIEHYKSLELTMPMILDSNKEIGTQYMVTSFPTMFVIDQSGKVESVYVGAGTGFDASIMKETKELLKAKASDSQEKTEKASSESDSKSQK